MLAMIQKIYSSHEAREQAGVFVSHFLLNLSFFLVMFIASKSLDAAEFANLSIANSWIMSLAAVFSFGMDQSALKLSIEHRTDAFIALNLLVKATVFVLVFSTFLIGMAFDGPSGNLLIAAAAAGVALWSSTRTVEQYERRFTRLAWLNVAFGAARLGLGGVAIASQSWVLIVLALHVIAQLPVHVTTMMTAVPELRSKAHPEQLGTDAPGLPAHVPDDIALRISLAHYAERISQSWRHSRYFGVRRRAAVYQSCRPRDRNLPHLRAAADFTA